MRFPRVKTRGLMVVVTCAGTLLGSVSWMGRRSARFEETSQGNYRSIRGLYWYGKETPSGPMPPYPPGLQRDVWAQEMFNKYRYAARHPWLPLEPDRPMPPPG